MSQPSSSTIDPPPSSSMASKPRTHVLCFDGTANEYSNTNTNVVKLYSLLKKDSTDEQICYYQAGIGTYFEPGVVQPIFQWGAKILDEAVAWYLSTHVMDGYKFLMQNYNVGDKVCLFGFSRGAYTARALAGMLHKVGLLSKDNVEQVPFAYKMYASTKMSDIPLAAGFKATFCRDVPLEFVGVWDTVASVGIIMTRTLPFVDTNTTIKTFRQALSLDEHRAKFRPNLYHRPNGGQTAATLKSRAQTFISAVKSEVQKVEGVIDDERMKLQEAIDNMMQNGDGEGDSNAPEPFVTDVDEVWFSGCHSDVGGGAVVDTAEYALANIPLRWMVKEIMLAQCGILFDDTAFARLNIPTTIQDSFKVRPDGQTTLHAFTDHGAQVDTNGGTQATAEQIKAAEDTRDCMDVVQPMDDELMKKPLWWLLEIIPTKYAYQNAQNKFVSHWSFHLGRGRYVPANPKFHESVKVRMDDKKLKYTPRAQYVKGTETYVV